MEHKAKKSNGKSKASSKEAHNNDKRKAESKASADLVNTTTAGTFTTPGNTEDVATLSASQSAQVFDMSASDDPIGDRQATIDAHIQGALEPVGTQASTEPIITEDGVIVRNA